MRASSPVSGQRSPRADAHRNRESILARAVELIAEDGPLVPLDRIARAAGVGNATLYRHFADRAALLRAVAVHTIESTAEAAERALAEEADSFSALARYLSDALRLRVAWVMPAIAAALPRDDPDVASARGRSAAAVSRLIAAAQRDGAIRPDLTFGDVSLLLIRLARPLPPGQERAVQEDVAHRHLAIVLAGMRPGDRPLPGAGVDLADLRRSRAARRPGNRTARKEP